jgi:large subunit ribosomal protein L35Ae
MQGKIIQFRRGRHTYKKRHFLIDVGAKTKEEAGKFIGKEVKWKSPGGKVIKGKISCAHGNKGLVRTIFEKGLPGQALNDGVEMSILASENKNAKFPSKSANEEAK